MTQPEEPPLGLLVSMALRWNHAFFLDAVPGSPLVSGFTKEQRDEAIQLMRDFVSGAKPMPPKLWEEVEGRGFWSPENNTEYEAAFKIAQEDTP